MRRLTQDELLSFEGKPINEKVDWLYKVFRGQTDAKIEKDEVLSPEQAMMEIGIFLEIEAAKQIKRAD
jgi:hypothetical protein